MKTISLIALLLLIPILGCTHRPPNDNTVQFRGCKVVEVDVTDGKALTCDCAHYRLAVDAKTGKRIALCGEK